MVKINLFKVLISTMILSLFVNVGFSTSALSSVLSSQNPEAVSPGGFVYVNVKTSNLGVLDNEADSTISLIENDNFKIAPGEDRVKKLGIIPSGNSVITRFKVLVNEDTPLGLNTLKFKTDSVVNSEQEVDILVQGTNPVFTISKIDVDTIKPGDTSNLSITVLNSNSQSLKNVIFKLNLDEVTDEVLSVKSKSNVQIIPIIKPDEEIKINFEVTVSPTADSQPYLIPINVKFEDSLENSYSQDIFASISVYSEPIFSLTLDSQDIYSIGKGKVSVAVANPGTSTIKGLEVELLPSDNYEVVSGRFQYIGNLNPDDFQTVQSEIYVKSMDTNELFLKVSYLDSYNNIIVKELSVPFSVYSDEELSKLSLNGSKSESKGIGSYVFMLVLIVVSFFIGMKYESRKAKKHK